MFIKNHKRVWSALIIGSVLLTALVVVAIARSKRRNKETSQQLTVLRGPRQNVRFTLYQDGIFPQQLHAKPGNVIIGIEDRTGNSSGLAVQLQTDTLPVAVGQVTAALNESRGRVAFSLGAGRYIVFDASRPNNRAELIVEP
jgi:hypothetical protein